MKNVESKVEETRLEAVETERLHEGKKEKHRKSLFREIVRFLVIGVLCTIIDFAIQFVLLKYAFANNLTIMWEPYGGYIAFGVSVTIAFLVANFINFLFSRLFVFRNVDKNINTKTQKAFWTYVGLGAIGWLIGLAIQETGVVLSNLLWDLNISLDITKVSWSDLFQEAGISLWAFVVIFAIKTLVTMIYNYVSRKFVIFKSPKKEPQLPAIIIEDEPEEAENQPEEEKAEPGDEVPPLVTAARFREIFREELDSFFGPGQVKSNAGKAWKMIYEEFDEADLKKLSPDTTPNNR